MPDHAIPELPRIAFVFGDAASAAHVREAMQGHADIAYAAPADAFDLAQLHEAGVSALLVNVDGGDWLGPLETALHGTGVAVVFNDPDISGKLDGWDRARWRRHLLAKMRGSDDVDPPRPEMPGVSTDRAVEAMPAPQAEAAEATQAVEPVEAVAERPLSPHEIETLTADFVAVPPPVSEPGDAALAEAEASVAVVPEAATPPAAPVDVVAVAEPEPTVAGAEPAITEPESAVTEPESAIIEPESAVSEPEPPVAEAASAEPALLDVDTETLSAMIDARLAEPAPQDEEAGEVWCIANDTAADARRDEEDAAAKQEQADEAVAEAAASQPPPVAAPEPDEVDVLAGLPSLDDWQLVDPDSAAAAPAASGSAKSTTDIDLSGSLVGIELVPMEANVAVQIHSEPTELWLDDEDGSRRSAERVRKERQA